MPGRNLQSLGYWARLQSANAEVYAEAPDVVNTTTVAGLSVYAL